MQAAFQELAAQYGLTKPFRLVAGGAERQDSVWNGLEALKPGIGNRGHPGRGAALHERRTDRRDHRRRARNGRGRGRAAGDGHHQGIGGRPIDQPHAGPRETLGGANAADVPRGGHPPRVVAGAGEENAGHGRHGGVRIDRPAGATGGRRSPNPKVTVPADLPYIELLLKRGS